MNNKKYVGQTSANPPSKRWGFNGCKYVNSLYFYRAITFYGWDNFQHIILKDNLTLEEANFWEKYFIKQLDTLSPNGYNLTTGGTTKTNYSQETLQRMSNSHLGYKKSEKTKQKMSQSKMRHEGYNKRKVVMCDKKTHQPIKIFNSLTEAELYCSNKNNKHISQVCSGKR